MSNFIIINVWKGLSCKSFIMKCKKISSLCHCWTYQKLNGKALQYSMSCYILVCVDIGHAAVTFNHYHCFHIITLGVNFVNVLCTCFSHELFGAKTLNPKHSFVIFGANILYKKCACKTLMKLTPVYVHTRARAHAASIIMG